MTKLTMQITDIYVTICISVIIILVFILNSTVYAKATTLKQRILPLNCLFTVVNAGTNQIQYITPAICEPIVVASPINKPITKSNTVLPVVNSGTTKPFVTPLPRIVIATPPSLSSVFKLDTYPEFVSNSDGPGKQLTIGSGQSILFSVSHVDYEGIIQITNPNSITVVLSHSTVAGDNDSQVLGIEAKSISLRVGESSKYDVNGDEKFDIQITLESITDGLASINFKQISEPKTASINQLDFFRLLPFLITLGLLAIAAILRLMVVRRLLGK